MKNAINLTTPVFFERNRVSRIYTGGKLFHGFFGDKPEDGNLPEEWVASAVKALNDNAGENDGLSLVKNDGLLFDKLLKLYPDETLGGRKNLGMLIKILDSAIRLPIQAHPDKAFSRKFFNSDYGKTEMWLVLATRPGAKVYIGFDHAVTLSEFKQRIEQSLTDKNAMVSLLNAVDVKPGEVYLIPAGLVHAIGSGCLILEVQEPTDFTIQPEAFCGDYKLTEYEKYLGLSPNDALGCFNLNLTSEEALKISRKNPQIILENDNIIIESLISYADTPCFAVNRITFFGAYSLLKAPAVYIAIDGEGELTANGTSAKIKKGDYFFLPYAAKSVTVTTGGLTLIECIPPASDISEGQLRILA